MTIGWPCMYTIAGSNAPPDFRQAWSWCVPAGIAVRILVFS